MEESCSRLVCLKTKAAFKVLKVLRRSHRFTTLSELLFNSASHDPYFVKALFADVSCLENSHAIAASYARYMNTPCCNVSGCCSGQARTHISIFLTFVDLW